MGIKRERLQALNSFLVLRLQEEERRKENKREGWGDLRYCNWVDIVVGKAWWNRMHYVHLDLKVESSCSHTTYTTLYQYTFHSTSLHSLPPTPHLLLGQRFYLSLFLSFLFLFLFCFFLPFNTVICAIVNGVPCIFFYPIHHPVLVQSDQFQVPLP